MIPSLVLVEVWHWTPLVMLIVLGGLAALPTEPYEIGAPRRRQSEWQLFRYITLPLVAPFLVVAAVIRTIDALKTFDTIYVITSGGPGTASETINLYLYLQAFAFYNIGNASAVVVVFFVIILALALLLLLRAGADAMDLTAAALLAAPTDAARAGAAMLRQIGFGLSVAGHRVAGDPGLPVDALALAQERDRQHRLSAGVHSRIRRRSPISSRCSRENSIGPLSLEQHRRLRRRDAGRARSSAFRPATASPARRRTS